MGRTKTATKTYDETTFVMIPEGAVNKLFEKVDELQQKVASLSKTQSNMLLADISEQQCENAEKIKELDERCSCVSGENKHLLLYSIRLNLQNYDCLVPSFSEIDCEIVRSAQQMALMSDDTYKSYVRILLRKRSADTGKPYMMVKYNSFCDLKDCTGYDCSVDKPTPIDGIIRNANRYDAKFAYAALLYGLSVEKIKTLKRLINI